MEFEGSDNYRELEPIRLRTMVLAQIGQLAEERRQLLRGLSRLDDARRIRNRLGEIDRQLSYLWEIRRHELL